MDFIGKVCPYCKAEFKEGDDVVICSTCEMPHHKECWIENQGCTTFGCTGTIVGVNNQSSTLYCTRCGKAYTNEEAFCSGCGNELSKPEQQQEIYFSNQQNTNYSLNSSRNMDDDIYTFIGEKQDYFLRKFEKLNHRSIKVSWNWASAFWGAYWYAFRKMYKIQFLYYVAYILNLMFFGMLEVLFEVSRGPLVFLDTIGFWIIPFVLSGSFSNYIYKCHVEKHVKRAESMEDYMRQNYLMKKGGTSGCALLVLITISLLLSIISRS